MTWNSGAHLSPHDFSTWPSNTVGKKTKDTYRKEETHWFLSHKLLKQAASATGGPRKKSCHSLTENSPWETNTKKGGFYYFRYFYWQKNNPQEPAPSERGAPRCPPAPSPAGEGRSPSRPRRARHPPLLSRHSRGSRNGGSAPPSRRGRSRRAAPGSASSCSFSSFFSSAVSSFSSLTASAEPPAGRKSRRPSGRWRGREWLPLPQSSVGWDDGINPSLWGAEAGRARSRVWPLAVLTWPQVPRAHRASGPAAASRPAGQSRAPGSAGWSPAGRSEPPATAACSLLCKTRVSPVPKHLGLSAVTLHCEQLLTPFWGSSQDLWQHH